MSTFAEKISSLKKLYKNQLKGSVLPFLKKNSIDKQYVGFFTSLDRAMGFFKPEDCIDACKWYIDRFLERSKNLRLFWIPYWRAVGFDNWKTDKFDFAYIQPNHFFNKTISYERLDAVCAFAKGTHMGLEMEFDESALADAKDSKRDRLVSYITAFEEHNVFRDASVAYYQGGSAIYQMSRSKNPLDRELLDRLAKIIIKRKKMKLPKK